MMLTNMIMANMMTSKQILVYLCTSVQKKETLYISMQCNALADYNFLQRMSINQQDELMN